MILRSLAVWLIIIGVETVHGILRRILLAPIVGDLHSNQIGVFLGSVLILIVVWIFYDWIKVYSFFEKIQIGLLWCLLTFGFEVGLGLAFGYSLQRILADYNPIQGGLMLFGMSILAFSLFIISKLRSK